jgi:putative membrane protein
MGSTRSCRTITGTAQTLPAEAGVRNDTAGTARASQPARGGADLRLVHADARRGRDSVAAVKQPELAGSVRERFSVTNDDLLGFGGEAAIYALNEEQVVRCYRAGTDRRRVEVRAAFYHGIARSDVPFKLPLVESIDVVDGSLYSIEQRIPGTSLTTALGALDGTERRRALTNYATAVEHIQSVALDDREFGELLADAPIKRRAWPAFLVDRAERALVAGQLVMKPDVPQLDDVLAAFREGTARVSNVVEPRLVHGDYFPGNVMVDERGAVTGILDFSPLTVAGDPRLDLAGALIFLEVVAPYRPEDSTIVEDVITARHGHAVTTVIELYRIYYSLYFSATKEFDPELYRWCVSNLTKRPVT